MTTLWPPVTVVSMVLMGGSHLYVACWSICDQNLDIWLCLITWLFPSKVLDCLIYSGLKVKLQPHVLDFCSLEITSIYRICSIRRHGYNYTILCGFYSRAATIWEQHLLNSVLSVKSFVNVRALRKVSFIRLAMWLLGFEANLPASWSAATLLYKAVPTRHLQRHYHTCHCNE